MRFQVFFFPFKEQSCFTALLKSNIVRTDFVNNICDYVASVISKVNFTLGYVKFSQCIFKDNGMNSIIVKNIFDVLIYDSYFHPSLNTKTFNCPAGIVIEGMANVRLWNSNFNGCNCTQQFIFDYGMSFPFNTRILTIYSSFVGKPTVLNTTQTDFLDLVEDNYFIEVEWLLKLHFEETPFAYSN